jgi:hypothetical protein
VSRGLLFALAPCAVGKTIKPKFRVTLRRQSTLVKRNHIIRARLRSGGLKRKAKRNPELAANLTRGQDRLHDHTRVVSKIADAIQKGGRFYEFYPDEDESPD